MGGTCPAGSWVSSTYTTGAITANCTVTFSGTALYTVTPSTTNVTTSPSGAQSVTSGGTTSFTVTANSGYTVSSTVGGTCPAGSWVGSAYTTGTITANCTVTFSGTALYTVTPSTTNVTTSPSGAQSVTSGGTTSFTVTANSGYVVSSTVGGTCPAGSWNGSTYTTGAITTNCSVSFSDTAASSWTWGVNCDGEGTFGDANFTASSTGFSGSGTCSRTSTFFTQFTFTSTSGASLQSSTIYAFHTGDVLVVPPTLSGEVEPIFMVQPACPAANQTLNWVFVQWDSGSDMLTNTYLIGTAGYNTTNGISVTGQYDVTGAAYYLGSVPMSGSCSNGIYNSSGSSSDLNGTVYFTTSGAGVYKTTLGHRDVLFPQYLTTPSTDLGSQSAPGMSFDSTTATNTREVRVTTDATGLYFTVQPYAIGNVTALDTSYTDTIHISQTNIPTNGMLIGTVTRTGTGAGTGKVACIVDKDFDFRVFCTGQSPSNNQYPYTTIFVVQTNCPANYVGYPRTQRWERTWIFASQNMRWPTMAAGMPSPR